MTSLAPIAEALRWLSAEFSVDRDELNRHCGPMLADALFTGGWVRFGRDNRKDRIAVSERGRRLLADVDRKDNEGAEDDEG